MSVWQRVRCLSIRNSCIPWIQLNPTANSCLERIVRCESPNPGLTHFQSRIEFQSTNGCGLSQSGYTPGWGVHTRPQSGLNPVRTLVYTGLNMERIYYGTCTSWTVEQLMLKVMIKQLPVVYFTQRNFSLTRTHTNSIVQYCPMTLFSAIFFPSVSSWWTLD